MKIHLKNGLAAVSNGGITAIEKKDIYITDQLISGVGEAPEGFSADRTIDCAGRLVLPGFINCHTHGYMGIFRNLADDRSFEDWLFGHIMPMEDRLTPEDMYWGTLLSCIEMLKTGTTAYLDMHMFRHYAAQAAADIGIRCALSRGLVGEDSRDPGGQTRLEDALSDREEFQDNSRITVMLGPHAPYTCAFEYLRYVAETARKYGMRIHIHLSETAHEVEESMEKYGCTPIAHMERLGLFEVPVIAAHCVYATDGDIEILKNHGASVATNPKSNLKLANGAAPIGKMMAAGVNVCLGTDSSASNNTQNMVSELNTLTLLHKGLSHDPKAVTAYEGLRIATANGARALGLNAGEIRVGALADLSVMNLDYPWLYPRNDLIAALSYSATGAEFETVLVDGQVVLDKGVITGVDEQEVYSRCEEIIRRVRG